MRGRLIGSLLVLAALLAVYSYGPAAKPAEAATPVTVGGGWVSFSFGGAGSLVASGPFTFSSTGQVVITVVDTFCKGDEFAILEGGLVVGRTTPVATGACTEPDDISNPDLALLDPRYSKAVCILRGGSHAVDILVVESPFGSGGAFLRVDPYVGQPLNCAEGDRPVANTGGAVGAVAAAAADQARENRARVAAAAANAPAVSAPRTGTGVTPPSTGDAGLAGRSGSRDSYLLGGLAALSFGGLGLLALRERRAARR